MRFYDFLFYASYKQGIKSRNYNDIPILGGMVPVSFCFCLNFATLYVILLDLSLLKAVDLDKIFGIILGILWAASLYFYYAYKGRYKRIIEKIERKKDYIRYYNIPYILVIFIYMAIAISILAIVGYVFIYKDIF